MGKWNLNDPSNTFLSNTELWVILFSMLRDKIQSWKPDSRAKFFSKVIRSYVEKRYSEEVEHPRVRIDLLINAYTETALFYTYRYVITRHEPWDYLPEKNRRVLYGLVAMPELKRLALRHMPDVPTYDPAGYDVNTLTPHMNDEQLRQCCKEARLSRPTVIKLLEVLDAINKKVSAQH